MREWQPIETAPKDGATIQAKIEGYGSDNLIAWQDGFMDVGGVDCGGWTFMSEQEPPSCWTDGVCWAFNEDGKQSAQPTEWKLLAE